MMKLALLTVVILFANGCASNVDRSVSTDHKKWILDEYWYFESQNGDRACLVNNSECTSIVGVDSIDRNDSSHRRMKIEGVITFKFKDGTEFKWDKSNSIGPGFKYVVIIR